MPFLPSVAPPEADVAAPTVADSNFSVAGEEDPGAAQDCIATASEGPNSVPLATPTAARSGAATRVGDIEAVARSRLITAAAGDTLLVEVAAGLSNSQQSVVVVCSASGEALGAITETLLARQLSLGQADLFDPCAWDVMSTAFQVCDPDDGPAERLDTRQAQGAVHARVQEAPRAVPGTVRPRERLRALMAADHEEEALLRQYVMGVGYQ